MWSVLVALALGATGTFSLDARLSERLLRKGGPQIGLWQALHEQEQVATALKPQSQQPFSVPKYQAHCFEQPISHFSSDPNTTFCQRYWLDATYYKPGGPVFVLDGGETSGANRIPFLEKGILQILANATGGLSIVLEHRYYGESIPVESLSTDNLRFLNNEEAMEDSAQFIEHFVPPEGLGIDAALLHPKNTPWIYYGGSYAGARSAHMRVQYPHLVWGAIASSAVTHAQVEFPEYHEPIRKYGEPTCIRAIEESIETIDTLLDQPAPIPQMVKSLFGLGELSHDGDFADVLRFPLGAWQGQNWDPAVGEDEWDKFCDVLTTPGPGENLGLFRIPKQVLNYAKWTKENVVDLCPRTPGKPAEDIEKCFGTHNATQYQETGLDQEWRLWLFQVTTQWGYYQVAPEEGPSLVSKRLDLEHSTRQCKLAFPDGEYFKIPELPDVESVNARGDYAIEADRLAFIDGDRDPWRPATPGSDIAPVRKSTVNKPVHLIFEGVHHYDENGLSNHEMEPKRIQDVHALEVNFVSEWVAQFHGQKAREQS